MSTFRFVRIVYVRVHVCMPYECVCGINGRRVWLEGDLGLREMRNSPFSLAKESRGAWLEGEEREGGRERGRERGKDIEAKRRERKREGERAKAREGTHAKMGEQSLSTSPSHPH